MPKSKWRLRCPHGHTSITHRATINTYVCETCRRSDVYPKHRYQPHEIKHKKRV